jgi:hypothetical protein
MKTIRALCLVSLVALLVTACGTSTGSSANLPKLETIANAKNATRALVIAEDIRVAARDHLAADVTADKTITAEETARMTRFDAKDRQFTDAWGKAKTAVAVWQTLGGGMPTTFRDAYALIINLAPQLLGGDL